MSMRVIALEEHFSIPALVKRIDPAVVSRRGFKPRKQVPGKPGLNELLAAAVELDVPIYIHPHLPPPAVHEIYYSGLPEGADRVLSTAGWGWHSEVAIHVLRMALAGTLDKHPRLK